VYSEVEIKFHIFLTSALDRDEWPASLSGVFTPSKETRVLFLRQRERERGRIVEE
jgi:hypothetical protein